jgi:hypothetical protein
VDISKSVVLLFFGKLPQGFQHQLGYVRRGLPILAVFSFWRHEWMISRLVLPFKPQSLFALLAATS